jgi:GNAT superfamily N-acetyltransferase
MFKVCWRWEMTPREYAAGYTYISSTKTADLPLATEPFPCPRLPLPGTEYTYQLAISDKSPSQDIQAVVGHHPELPRSGDRRSGVLVFHGDTIIASAIFLATHSLVVHPDYRNLGLAARMFLEWNAVTKRPFVSIHNITLATAKTLLRAHRDVVERAVAEGKPVPERVQQAIQDASETAAILKQAALTA